MTDEYDYSADDLWEIVKKMLKDLGLWDLFKAYGFSQEDEESIKRILKNMRFYGFSMLMGPHGSPILKEIHSLRDLLPPTTGSNSPPAPAGMGAVNRAYAGGRRGANDYLADVYEEGDRVTIIIEVPGASSSNDIRVTVLGNRVIIDGPEGYSNSVKVGASVKKSPTRVSCRNGICEIVLEKET